MLLKSSNSNFKAILKNNFVNGIIEIKVQIGERA